MQNEIRGNTCFLIVLIFERWNYLWKKLVSALSDLANFSYQSHDYINCRSVSSPKDDFLYLNQFSSRAVFPSSSSFFLVFSRMHCHLFYSSFFVIFPVLQNAFALLKNGYDKLINDGKEILPRQATAAIFSQKFQLDCVLMGIGISFFTRSI